MITEVLRRLFASGMAHDDILATVAEIEGGTANKPRKAQDRGTRLPDDWKPTDEHIHFALLEGFDLISAHREADKFRDYWCGKGKDASKRDWTATWRNWVRKASKGRQVGGKPVSEFQAKQDRMRKILDDKIGTDRYEPDHTDFDLGPADYRTVS